MKKQKKDKRRQSTQQLMGIQKITDYCISTDTGDLVFYIVRPSNLGVLPANAIYARIEALKNVLSTQANIELLALNSRESFTQNRVLPRPAPAGNESGDPALIGTGSTAFGRDAGGNETGAGVLSGRAAEG